MAYEYRELSRDGSIDEKFVRRYTRVFQVVTDDPKDGPGTVSAYVPLNMWSSYVTTDETDLPARLKNKSAKQVSDQGGRVWEVTCQYDSLPFDIGNSGAQTGSVGSPAPGQTANNTLPWDRPWVFKFGSNKSSKLLPVDLAGVGVVNSVGQPFSPPVECPTAFPTFQIDANKQLSSWSPSYIMTYTNTINSDVFVGFPAKRLRCVEYTATTANEDNTYYWQLSVTIEVNPDVTWNPVKVLNAGKCRAVFGKPPQPILDSQGSPVQDPVPLNIGTGQPLNAGDPVQFLDFQAYREVAFSGILG